jgi:hypothetical protein
VEKGAPLLVLTVSIMHIVLELIVSVYQSLLYNPGSVHLAIVAPAAGHQSQRCQRKLHLRAGDGLRLVVVVAVVVVCSRGGAAIGVESVVDRVLPRHLSRAIAAGSPTDGQRWWPQGWEEVSGSR